MMMLILKNNQLKMQRQSKSTARSNFDLINAMELRKQSNRTPMKAKEQMMQTKSVMENPSGRSSWITKRPNTQMRTLRAPDMKRNFMKKVQQAYHHPARLANNLVLNESIVIEDINGDPNRTYLLNQDVPIEPISNPKTTQATRRDLNLPEQKSQTPTLTIQQVIP